MLSAHEEIAFGRRKIWSASLHIPLAECFMATKLPLHIAFGNASFEIACGHEGIYFASFDATASNFTMTVGHYFISEGYFIKKMKRIFDA